MQSTLTLSLSHPMGEGEGEGALLAPQNFYECYVRSRRR